MNDKNLVPFNKRTESEQREIRKKGGIKSGEARRRKRTLKQLARQFLAADTGREDLHAALQESGFDDDHSNAAVLIMQIANEAFSGNMRAAELLIKISGEDPDQQREDKKLKMKKMTMTSGAPDIEDLACIWGMINEPDTEEEQ